MQNEKLSHNAMFVGHHTIFATLPFVLQSVASFIPPQIRFSKQMTILNMMDASSSSNYHHFGKDLEEEKGFVPKIPTMDNSLYAFLQDNELFLLGNAKVQYVLHLHRDTGKITFLHWGPPLSSLHPLPYDNLVSGGDEYSSIYSDYPIYGDGDDREPALKISSLTTGISSFDFRYVSHEVIDGKVGEIGNTKMPCTYTESDDEAKTLVIKLMDYNVNIEICLFYTVFKNYRAIARHTEIYNHGTETISIDRIASWSLDLPPSPHESGYSFLQLAGAWGREGQEVWNTIHQGKYVVGDMEGSQVHRSNPFVAVADGDVNEDTGTVFAFSFIYSGAFQSVLQMNQMGLLRVNMGMNPDMFRWKLESGESFVSPECVAVFSNNGLGAISRDYHSLYRTRLARGQWRDRLRPILLNTWEPFGFDFTHDKLMSLAQSAKAVGVELFVLDDGWFGSRNSDRSGLGDWFPNPKKLPSGLVGLANDVNRIGLDFGIW
jgi:alpha-galactosidase